MRNHRALALPLALAVVLAAPPDTAGAGDMPVWPAEQEARLKELDAEVLSVQQERFTVLFFSKDEGEKARVEKRFGELLKERRQLLQAMGKR